MLDYNIGSLVYKIINSAKTSVKRDRRTNETRILDSKSFKGLPMKYIDEITIMVDEASKDIFKSKGIHMDSLKVATEKANKKIMDSAVTFVKSKHNSGVARKVYDNIFNSASNINTSLDPTRGAEATPNLWISPYEANSMYSQKGLPETIINKKSKSILLNGLKIKNAKLSAKQIDQVSLHMVKKDIPKLISDAVRDALVYGGALVFPMFNKDNPVTTNLNLAALLKQGILKKDSIDYLITLDRWNTMHLPAVNPTQKDFFLPRKYYIPYLGADVHGSRCCRIVTANQAGFFGHVMTFGWGLSDFCGYTNEILNYKIAVQTLPMMIQQMSLLARTINIDGILAQEGANILDELTDTNTIRTSEWSINNPITLDMLGELQVINRDFGEVPALLRILRQDLAASANIPEPMLFSSEKGNFSSGDDTEGNMAKQYESIKFIHKDVETQFKPLAKMLLIDALGTDKEIIEALPYTQIHFDTPIVANSTERAEIGLDIGKTFFEFVSGQMPLDEAARIASAYAGDEMSIDSELLERLSQRQKDADEHTKEKQEKEMELLEAQIEATKVSTSVAKKGGSAGSTSGQLAKKSSLDKQDEGYSRLEQEFHEKSRMPGQKTPEKLSKRTAT